MIRPIDDLPANVVGIEAVGTVSADDYDNVINPSIDEATKAGDGLRVLYLLGDDFEGYEADAALDDLKMGMHHWSEFERVALVTDNTGYRTMFKAFGFLVHGEVKVFNTAELGAAKDWVAG